MSLATSNRDGGRTNEAGHLRGVTKGFVGQVLEGLAVSQRGAGANMSVDVAIGDAIIQRSDGTYGHPAWNDAVYNQVISAADGSNPRRDIIVMYIDYGQTPSTGVANNTNGVVKIKSVSGTAAGSPVDPSTATIQSSVGSGNPFVRLARVRVAAGATSISNSVIDDLRLMATAQPQGGWIYDSLYSWVYASSTTFTIAGVDATAQFPVGTKLRINQSGSVKYFVVTAASFSTNTTVTISGGGTYTLANAPLDKPAYSYVNTPSGYPVSLLGDPTNWYQELGRITGSGTSVTLSGLPPKDNLILIMYGTKASTNGGANLTFNGDTGSNYATRVSNNGATDATAMSGNSVTFCSPTTDTQIFSHFVIRNLTNMPKILIGHTEYDTPGAANPPNRQERVLKWNNTGAKITSVTVDSTVNLTNFTIIVLGHD